jgi:transposase-like protein
MGKLAGKSTRPGVYKCRPCQKPFSVTVGTVFERSKIKLNVWVQTAKSSTPFPILFSDSRTVRSHSFAFSPRVSREFC